MQAGASILNIYGMANSYAMKCLMFRAEVRETLGQINSPKAVADAGHLPDDD